MTETLFTSPKAIMELQGRFADAVLEAADETTKRAEQAVRESATTFANAMHTQTERAIDALSVSAKLRAKTFSMAREAFGTAPVAAAK